MVTVQRRHFRWQRYSANVFLFGIVIFIIFCFTNAFAQKAPLPDEPPPPLISLKQVPVPGPSSDELYKFVQDKAAAIQLGKALFWDTRVGSDNKTACASCHFHAGADNRTKNQLNPGVLANDKTFQVGGPNYKMTASDFPFTKHADVDDASSRISDKNDVSSSQGVLSTKFSDVSAKGEPDKCTAVSDAVFHGGTGFNLNGVNTRRVEPRNAPSVFNAVFNFRNFWDGRANNMFNGGDPFGLRNSDMFVWTMEGGVLRQVQVGIPSTSLASLSSGPPLSENEMSCKSRTFAHVGRKLVNIRPLMDQAISPDDSVLGPLAKSDITYATLIKRAFRPDYWRAGNMIFTDAADALKAKTMDLEMSQNPQNPREEMMRFAPTQLEANFALFFGVAVNLYQSTLISSDTPFDRFVEGDMTALNEQQLRGLAIFRGPAQCVHCHKGAEFTSASFSNLAEEGRLDSRPGDNQTIFRYDNGFFNTGVRPTMDDGGVGGKDPFDNSLSEVRLAQAGKSGLLGNSFDMSKEDPLDAMTLTAVDGAFKTPGLRNVEFTGPYFHNGGKATLMQVMDFYSRGGDFAVENHPVPDPTIRPLGFSQMEKEDLVAFLLSLSDDRVRYRRAPFDHPSICVPDGHEGDHYSVKRDMSGNAADEMKCMEEVGRMGAKMALRSFLDLDPFAR
ncbi:MAG: hypothetical protein JWQ23_3454 [Herminiimonas sp.]|nr:hypothetical protein [Herminiimonas sp.]